MVILRQERIFSYVGKGKFAECWMIIIYDTTGPSIQLFKDQSAKKSIFEKLHVPSMASQIRFGTTCKPYGNLPEIKADPKIDSACMMALQVERRVKKEMKAQILWLCAESTKQMFGILKILACGLTIMAFPAPAKNQNPNDLNALHHYRPRILQPTNVWEEFWDNPPDARIISPMELSQHVAKSMDALNTAIAQQRQEVKAPVETVVKSKSTPELENLVTARRNSVASRGSSFSSSRSSTSRSLSGRRRSVRVWELNYTRDMERVPFSPQKIRKYERQESARSSPIILRQIERQQKKAAPEPPFEEEEPIYIKQTMQPYNAYYPQEVQGLKTAPLINQEIFSPKKHVYDEVPEYDKVPDEEEPHHDDEDCQVCHPPPTHHHRLHKHHPHRRYSHSVDLPHSHSPPQSILKRQQSAKQRTIEDEVQPQVRRPVSGYSSSAYGSGHVTPTHLYQPPPKKEFEVELLRRMSDLSLRPLSRTTFTSPQISHYERPIEKQKTSPHKHHVYDTCHSPIQQQPLIEEPIMSPANKHNIIYEPQHYPIHTQQPLIEYKNVEEPQNPMNLLEQSAVPLQKERRISDPEYLVKPKVKRRSKPQPVFVSQGVQTDHELPNPPVPLIENFEFAQTKRFTFESHEPHLHHYRKLSHQSSRSIYIQRVDDSNDYESVRPFFRTDSSSCASECHYNEYTNNSTATKRHSNPLLVNDNQGTRTYTIDVEGAAGLL